MEGSTDYFCPRCYEEFKSLTHLQKHLKKKTVSCDNVCDTCGTIFYNRRTYYRHFDNYKNCNPRNVENALKQMKKKQMKHN